MKKRSNDNTSENTETFERVRTPRKEDLEQLAVVVQLIDRLIPCHSFRQRLQLA